MKATLIIALILTGFAFLSLIFGLATGGEVFGIGVLTFTPVALLAWFTVGVIGLGRLLKKVAR